MTSRQLIVHIGPPKVATTAIQRMLSELAPTLRRQDIHYLSGGRHDRINHNCILQPDASWAPLESEILASSAKKFVISAENFLRPPTHTKWPRRLAALADAVNAKVLIVAYVRPQYRMLESLYNQWIRNGSVIDAFETFVTDMLQNQWLDYNWMFRPWREVLGAEAITVTPLERQALGGDVRAHFIRLLGISELSFSESKKPANTRRGAKELAVRGMVGAALAELPTAERQRLMSHRLGRLRFAFQSDKPFAPLTISQVAEITNRFAEPNNRFAQEYRIDPNGQLFRGPLLDDLERPSLASWSDLRAEEQLFAQRLVRLEFGIDIANGSSAIRNGDGTFDGLYLFGKILEKRVRRAMRRFISPNI